MSHRALAVPQPADQAVPSPSTASMQVKAVTLGVALRYLAVRRTKVADARPPVQRPILRVVT